MPATLQHDDHTERLKREIHQAGRTVIELVGDLANIKTRLEAIQAEVDANDGGVFDNPTASDVVTAQRVAMRTVLKDFVDPL